MDEIAPHVAEATRTGFGNNSRVCAWMKTLSLCYLSVESIVPREMVYSVGGNFTLGYTGEIIP